MPRSKFNGTLANSRRRALCLRPRALPSPKVRVAHNAQEEDIYEEAVFAEPLGGVRTLFAPRQNKHCGTKFGVALAISPRWRLG